MSGSEREPNDLVRSDLFLDDQAEARELWAKGFRPVHAEDVPRGAVVVYRATDPLAGEPHGERMYGTVERVEVDPAIGAVRVHHSGGVVTEADEWDEGWAKPPWAPLHPSQEPPTCGARRRQ
jgi:hypothetical protein